MRNMWNLVCSVVPVWAVCGLACLAQAQQPEDPYAHHTVLIETFVVELTTEAVREAGGDIVGRDPSGISISKLLWALRDEDNGQVVSGLKINAVHGQRNVQAQEEVTQYYPSSNPQIPVVPTQRQRFTTSRVLTVERLNIISANSVLLSYSYSENIFVPNINNVTVFSGSLTATPGVPVIAGASQNDDTVRILVFVVTLVAPAEPDADAPVVKLTREDVSQTLDTYFARWPDVASFHLLELGEPIRRADGRTAIHCKYKLIFWEQLNRPAAIHDQMIFFNRDGSYSERIAINPVKYKELSAEPAAGEKHATARDENNITAFLNEIIPTVQFSHNIPPVEALRQLGRTFKVNIIPSQKVSELRGPFSIFQLYDVTFDEILELIPGNYHYVIDGKFIRIYTAEEFAEMPKDAPEPVDLPAVVEPEFRHEDRSRDDR